MAIIALAISLPGSSFFGLVVLWLCVVYTEISLWFGPPASAGTLRRQRTLNVPLVADLGSSVVPNPVDKLADSWEPPEAPATQQLIYRTIEGRLTVEGWFRVAFTAGQRVATAHIAFCPAFQRTPQVDVEPSADSECTVEPALVLPWGVRWEIKLDSPAAAEQMVTIEFFAQEAN